MSEDGRIRLAGRFDASQTDRARAVFRELTTSCTVDLQELEYVSSAGLAVLLETQKRLMADGHGLTLVKMPEHIRLVFDYARFDSLFEII